MGAPAWMHPCFSFSENHCSIDRRHCAFNIQWHPVAIKCNGDRLAYDGQCQKQCCYNDGDFQKLIVL